MGENFDRNRSNRIKRPKSPPSTATENFPICFLGIREIPIDRFPRQNENTDAESRTDFSPASFSLSEVRANSPRPATPMSMECVEEALPLFDSIFPFRPSPCNGIADYKLVIGLPGGDFRSLSSPTSISSNSKTLAMHRRKPHCLSLRRTFPFSPAEELILPRFTNPLPSGAGISPANGICSGSTVALRDR